MNVCSNFFDGLTLKETKNLRRTGLVQVAYNHLQRMRTIYIFIIMLFTLRRIEGRLKFLIGLS